MSEAGLAQARLDAGEIEGGVRHGLLEAPAATVAVAPNLTPKGYNGVMRLTLALLVLLAACGSSQNVLNAAIGVGVAAGAAGVERASGGCYATCISGTVCNPKTGFCDPLPCAGRCRTDEACEDGPAGGRCVPAVQPDVLPPAGWYDPAGRPPPNPEP